MAKKNFSDTQTGGEGTTPQVGEKPTQETEVKKDMAKPITPPAQGGVGEPPVKADTPPVDDGRPKREDYPTQAMYLAAAKRYNEQQKAAPKTPAPAVVEPTPSIPLESEKSTQEELFPEEKEEKQLVAPFPELDAQEEVVKNDSFSIPWEDDEEDLTTLKEDPATTQFLLPEENELAPQIEDEEPPADAEGDEPKILGYPGRKTQYVLRDGDWYEREDDSQEWTKITKRSRVFGLNDYHFKQGNIKEKARIPERNYFPPKGGMDFEGIKVYGNPYREGTMYTIQNGRWFKVEQGNKEWEAVDSDKTIKALNQYHGTDVQTRAQKMSRAANVAPATSTMLYGDDLPMTTIDLARKLKEASKMPEPRKIDNVEQAGDILQQRGLEIEADDAAIKATINVEEGQMANKMYSTGTDVMFNLPPRPTREDFTDDISWNMAVSEWAKKYGSPLPPRGEGVQWAEKEKEMLLEDRDFQLEQLRNNGLSEEDPAYQATVADFDNMIVAVDKKIEDAKAGLEIQRQDFQTRHEYMQSEQYQLDKKNSPYYKIAQIQNKMNALSYGNVGMYDAEGIESQKQKIAESMVQIDLLRNEIERDKLKNFVAQDVDKLYDGTSMTDNQKAQLKMAQKRAQQILDKGALPGEAEKLVQETYAFMETTRDINNRIADAYNSGQSLSDVLAENKKVLLDQN